MSQALVVFEDEQVFSLGAPNLFGGFAPEDYGW